ncbi:MAG: carboxylesterase/lipase family protein [Myxococcota bacterium]
MDVIVETRNGKVSGERLENLDRFRGIPYAAPPVAELRFRATRPATPWPHVREAHAFGRSAPQNPSFLPGMESGPQSEDCLYLNVYTPRADGGKRPVLFWIHGGGFTGGSGGQALYDGGRLAARGDVVVVTINYRLGALGYTHIAGLDANLGQQDQIAALRWLRENIAAFGGDPAQVTIFGESAGGMAVSTLLAMPAASGLFRGAIAQSGAAHHVHSRASAERIAHALLGELGLGASEHAKLRDVPVPALLAAQANVLGKSARLGGLLAFAPALDADTLPRHPLEAVRDGAARDVALLVGANRDETKLFRMGMASNIELDEAGLAKRVRGGLRAHGADESHAERLIETYRSARNGRTSTEPGELLDALDSDRTFRVPAIRLAEAQGQQQPRTYQYFFTWSSPARRGTLGACHALELPFVFGTLDAPTMDRFAGKGPDAEALSARMMDAWIAFARKSEPGHAQLPAWPAYDTAKRATLVFDRACQLALAPLDAERAAWDGVL